MRRNGRLLWRMVAAITVCVAGMLSVLAVRPLVMVSRSHELRARRVGYRAWGKALMRVLHVRVHMIGVPPELPFLLVSNHLSYVDIAVLASLQPGRFVAKAELQSWPLVGWMCRSVDTIFVDRASRRDVLRVGKLIKKALDEGDAVVLFPEGTSTNGNHVAGFRPSLLAPAANEGIPVHTVALRYETPEGEISADESVAWWGGAEFTDHIIGLFKLPYIDATVSFAPEPIRNLDRKRLALDLHQSVRHRFAPMTDRIMPPGPVPILPPPPLIEGPPLEGPQCQTPGLS